MSGFFIDVGSYTKDYYAQLEHIARRHRGINEVVIFGAAPWNIGVSTPPQFKRYVGAAIVPWVYPRHDTPSDLQDWMRNVAGVGGMLTPSYRWEQIATDEQVAKYYLPGTNWNFYIGQEVDIVALGDHPKVRQAWEAYLTEICKRLYAIDPNVTVLWSPYAWEQWSKVSSTRRTATKNAVLNLLINVRRYSGTPGITVVDLQDGRGVQPLEPETDAVNWYNLINRDINVLFRINMEYFTQQFTPQPPEEMERREAYYASKGVPIGNCWELRYW